MNEQLLGYLFGDKPHTLTVTMRAWIGLSPRFKAFVTAYRDKIRKKIKVTQSSTAIKDLEVELETAYWLLREQRFVVVYEPYNSEKIRGPDFAITFKTITFNVEVTRMGLRRTEPASPVPEGEIIPWLDPQQVSNRFMDTVCDKLSQMRSGMINVLMVAVDGDFAHVLDMNQTMARLRERAERKEAGLFGRYGFSHTADFFKYYLRLSGVLVRSQQDGIIQPILWVNNQAKHAIPGPIRTIFQRR